MKKKSLIKKIITIAKNKKFNDWLVQLVMNNWK